MPTIDFDTVMTLYYGFFGLTCMLMPSIHAADGPVPNPLAYWTTVSADVEFAFRIAGAGMTCVAIGPRYLGVSADAFVKQTLFMNTFFFFLFEYYAFYAPLATAVTLMWTLQAYLCALILGWNVVEAYGGMDAKTVLLPTFAKLCTYFFGFFGVSLLAAPELFFGGAANPMAYWTEWGTLANMCARSMGACIVSGTIIGYNYHDLGNYVKQLAAFSVVNIPLMSMAAFYSSGAAVVWIWKAQLAMQVAITFISVWLVLPGNVSGVTPYTLNFSPPTPCFDLKSAESFVFINICFFAPFVLGFLTVPNLIFGPSSPSGMPMFTEDLNETALWFGRAWAISVFILVIGSAAFGHKHINVCKQLLLPYITACILFPYYLTTTTVFNPVMVWPMTALNYAFLLADVLIIKASVDGGLPFYQPMA